MPEEALKQAVEKYIQENNTCALATGSGDYVRCTPIEYSYHDGKFWMFSEGGEKFIGLEKNANVSLAILTSMMDLVIWKACASWAGQRS